MQKHAREYLDELNRRHRKNRRALVAWILMSVLVVGSVMGTLTQYGVALENSPGCGQTEHTHNAACYAEDELVCDREEHTHGSDCFGEPEGVNESQPEAATAASDAAADTEDPDVNAPETIPSESESGPTETAEPETTAAPDEDDTDANEPETTPSESESDPAETVETEEITTEEETAAVEETTAEPEETTTEATTEAETETEEETETEIAKKDFSGLLSLEELEALSEDEAGATMWEDESAVFGVNRMRRTARATGEYAFDAYYVNQDDNHDVTLTQDGNLKYQLVFRAYENFEREEIKIRIDRELLEDRDGNPVLPVDIAVPEAKKDEHGDYMTETEESADDTEIGSGNAKEYHVGVRNKSTSFNYYIEEKGGREYLVFFNYEPIAKGTNAAWQVLYKNLKIMELVDESEWELNPQILIGEEAGGNQYQSAEPLTGHVDSGVTITSLSVTAYKDTDKNYTPGLYTQSQVEAFIGGELPEEYRGDKFQDWRFVVWDVKVTGTATQPWSLEAVGAPSYTYGNYWDGTVNGQVVGYKDNSRKNTTYWLPINSQTVNGGEGGGENADSVILLGEDSPRKDDSWGSRFYMVTAYPFVTDPADGSTLLTEGMALVNLATLTMVGADYEKNTNPADNSAIDFKIGTAQWDNVNYRWTYKGKGIGTRKEEDKTYKGWLTVYDKSEKDYAEFPFTTTGTFDGYNLTHGVESDNPAELGKYRPGTFYQLATTDDLMYLHYEASEENGQPEHSIPLDQNDYYYTRVSITQKDVGYDVWEDRTSDPESLNDVYDRIGEKVPDDMNQDVYIFAMFAKDPRTAASFGDNAEAQNAYAQMRRQNNKSLIADNSNWEYVDTIQWNDSGVMSYNFSQEQLDREPYRIMVVHNTINYSTRCDISVDVRMRKESPKMREIGSITLAKIEDLSASLGAWYKYENGQRQFAGSVEESVDSSQYTGRGDGLLEETQGLYNGYMPSTRDNAYKTVTGLEPDAVAKKTAKTTNDPGNGRVYADFCLTAYNGYEIYSQEAVNNLKNSDTGDIISPGHKTVEFYDLLPYGMSLDLSQEVTAGRITDLKNKDYSSQPRSWAGSQIKVEISKVEDNWRDTGRTMVVFRVTYEGADPTVYTDGKWIEGWGVSFRAYYDINNLDVVQAAHNIFAFMPAYEDGETSLKPLCGTHDVNVFRDDGRGENGQLLDGEYADFAAGNINGNGADDEQYVVMYGKTDMNEEISVAGEQSVQKLVRADSNQFGTFGENAVVEPGGGYTYEITMTATDKMTDVVVFDQLEAVDDVTAAPAEGEAPLAHVIWEGTFRSVDTTGVEAFEPVVYYSDTNNNPVSKPEEGGTPEDLEYQLTSDNGWYTWDEFVSRNGNGEEAAQKAVRTIAVKLGRPLENQSVSFRIKMTAPTLDELKRYGFDPELQQPNHVSNRPTYDGTADKNQLPTYNVGNITNVSISTRKDLEVVKAFAGDVPSLVSDTQFEFNLTEEDGTYFVFREYELWKKVNGQWQRQEDRRYATDGEGRLYLRADEKAVFRDLPEADHIVVKESAGIFWDVPDSPEVSERTDEVQNDDGTMKNVTTRVMTFKNAYRPVLYVRKNAAFMPEGMNAAERTFLFQAEVLNEATGEYEPLKEGQVFYYVKNIRTDGGMPDVVMESGSTRPKTGTIGKNGTFEIKPGEIIVLFPGKVGTNYRVTEVTDLTKMPEMFNWICQKPSVEGTVSVYGTTALITNYYKWKDLLLTKELEGQKPEDCEETFVFRIEQVIEGEAGGETAEEETKPIEGNRWVLLDQDGKETETAGTVGKYMDAAGAEQSEAGIVTLKAGQTIKIKNLEAGKTYIITELNDETHASENIREYYRPVNDKAEVTMPLYSAGSSAKIVNEYLLLPMSVTKTVLYNVPDEEGDGDSQAELDKVQNTEFTMIAMVQDSEGEYQPLANHPYTLKNGGTDTGNGTLRTDENGAFTLKNGETALFEGVAKEGTNAVIWEVQDSTSGFEQVYPEYDLTESTEELSAGLPKGYQMKSVDDSQTETDENPGINYVGAPNRAVFSDKGASFSFVNAQKNMEGMLFLSKKYTGDQRYLDMLNTFVESEEYKIFLNELSPRGEANEIILSDEDMCAYSDAYVMFYLNVTDADGNEAQWPREEDIDLHTDDWWIDSGGDLEEKSECGCNKLALYGLGGNYATVRIIAADGSIRHRHWRQDEPLIVYPGEIILVPADNIVSYTLTEDEEYQHQIRTWMVKKGQFDDRQPLQRMSFSIIAAAGAENLGRGLSGGSILRQTIYLEITQETPEAGQGVSGTVKENPSATIYNHVICHEMNNVVYKEMLSQSSVTTGAKLVWRVERYDKAEKKWYPAEGIAYLTSKGSNQDMTCDQLLHTGADGKITLIKEEPGIMEREDPYPQVHFAQRVYLNLYKQSDIDDALKEAGENDLLRVVEVPEETDETWGMLAGYRDKSDVASEMTRTLRAGNLQPGDLQTGADGLNASWETADCFVNSNMESHMTISKKTTVPSTEVFTVNLRQVLSTWVPQELIANRGSFESVDMVVKESVFRQGVPYRLYDTETGARVDDEIYYTGINGEIYLMAGQSAQLDVPMGTMWTVSEDVPGNYSLKELVNESPDMVVTFENDPNLALVSIWPETRYYVRYYDVLYTGEDGETETRLLAEERVLSGTKVKIKDMTPEQIDYTKLFDENHNGSNLKYEFSGWHPNSVNDMYLYEANKEIEITENLNLYVRWDEKQD